MHPGPVGGVQRNIAHPQQGFAVPGLRNRRLRHLEVFGPEFPGRFLDQQDLAIDAVIHGIPSLTWQFLAVLDAIDCVSTLKLHTLCAAQTLVGGRPFHNGNIVANAPGLEACCVAAKICQTRGS